MGASTRLAVYSAGNPRRFLSGRPVLNREASQKLAEKLFPDKVLLKCDDGNLTEACPSRGEIYVGCFPGVTVVSAAEFPSDFPSRLAPRWLDSGIGRVLHLHVMSGADGGFAYGIWQDGKLSRSLSLAPETGIIEELGERQAFELGYWAGQHADSVVLRENAPLLFHPTDLGEAALFEFFGYQLEGEEEGLFDPGVVPLMHFAMDTVPTEKSKSRWWKFW